MKKTLFLLSWLLFVSAYADQGQYEKITIPNIELKDTVFKGYVLEATEILAIVPPKNLGLSSRDKMYLRKVYPYALRVAHLVEQIDTELNSLDRNRKRRRYINEMRKMLKDRFTDDVKDLTRIQGQMLTKLIHRETNQTAFDLIKNYRNGMAAGWWNMLGKFYAQNLKMEYDPKGEDKEIERYVQYLDQIYNRDGVKDTIQQEKFLPPSQIKSKRK